MFSTRHPDHRCWRTAARAATVLLAVCLCLFLTTGCTTYSHKIRDLRPQLANGEFEEMDHVIDTNMRERWEQRHALVVKFAAMGEAEATARLISEEESDPDAGGFFRTLFYAWAGRRADANLKAAYIDQQVFGPQALILQVYWCMCGAPFDLEATPNFAAKLEEAGLAWPPPLPINWPLKDW